MGMGRAYAGILGYLAASLTLLRGVTAGGGVEGTLQTAIAALAVFTVVGWVLGTLAQATVDQAVGQRLQSQLAAARSPDSQTAASP